MVNAVKRQMEKKLNKKTELIPMKYPLELFFLVERLCTKTNLPSTVETIKTTKEKITAVFIAEAFELLFAENF